MGHYGDSPLKRITKTEYGMAGTTSDLFVGTTKSSRKIPGYGGHIPINTWNKYGNEQGHREGGIDYVNNDLRLTYNNNKQGYCGYTPAAPSNWHGANRPDPNLTTTESALSSAQKMWQESDLKTAKKINNDFWHRIPVI